jgi:hypothetical protein
VTQQSLQESVVSQETALQSDTSETEDSEPTATSKFSGDVRETTKKNTPTPTEPKEEPVEEEPDYTFDLTDDVLLFETENRLSFFSSYEEIVILGGSAGIYRLDAGDVADEGMCYSNGCLQMYLFSLNRDSIAFLSDYSDGEIWDTYFSGHGTLMYYDGTKAVKIAEDVRAFELSDDGTGVAYRMSSETPENGSELYVYNTETKKSVLISDIASDAFVCSPDGDTIAYQEYINPGKSTVRCGYYQVIGKEPVEVKQGATPVALSDNGDNIYYFSGSVFTCQSGDYTRVLCSYSDYEDEIIFNRDHTQVLFTHNSDLYFSKNGGTPIIFPWGLPLILEREGYEVKYRYSNYYRSAVLKENQIRTYTINKKNLCNLLLQGDENLFYFDENMQKHTLEQENGRYGHYVGDCLGILYLAEDPETGRTIHCYLSNFMDPDCVPLIIGNEYVNQTDIVASGAIFYDNDIGQIFRLDPDGSRTLVDTYASLAGCADYSGITYVYYNSVLIGGRGAHEGSLYCKEESTDIDTEPFLIDDSNYNYANVTDAGLIFENNWRGVDDDYWSDSLYDLHWSVDGIHFSLFMTMLSVSLC